MNYVYQTELFDFSYTESTVENHVLWESHCHARYEMIAVLEGDIGIMLEGRTYRLTENQTIIIPPLLYHAITANKKGAYRRITVLFDIHAVPAVLQDCFLRKAADLTICTSRQLKDLQWICRDAAQAFYEPLAQSLMIGIFYNHILTNPAGTGMEADAFLQKILQYIEQHLGEKILLDHLAAHTARSKSSVCHLFEEKMGISPRQYILQKKLALASKLIRDGTPPTLAAMQVGYDNYSAFYRTYRKYFGTNPSEGKAERE